MRIDHLALHLAQFAAPRDEPGCHLGRTDDQRRIGFEQFPLRGDEPQSAPRRAAQRDRIGQLIDKPSVAEQVLDQRPVSRLVSDQPVGSPDHAGPALQVAAGNKSHRRRPGGGGRQSIQADQADSSLRHELAGFDAADQLVAGHDDVLRGLAQCNVHQRGDLDAGFQEIGDHAVDLRAFLGGQLARFGQQLLHSAAQPGVLPFEFFEHFHALARPAVFALQDGDFLLPARENAAALGQFDLDRFQGGALGVSLFGQPSFVRA